MIRKKRLVKLTRALVRINSENPLGDESAIAEFLSRELKKAKLKIRVYEFKKNRTNVLAYLKGKTGKSLLISPHLDTVPAGSGWKYNAFSGKIVNGRIYGRGASDCKCNVAIAVEAIRSIAEDNITPPCNIIFAACADEETGSKYGIVPLLEKKIINPGAALILDSDELDIITHQKGLMHFKVGIFGKSAHGAYPERGISAIEISAQIISRLKKHKFRHKFHPLLGSPTVNIGKICGGQKVNIVADFCEFEVDLRYLPGMREKKIIEDIKKIIRKYARSFRVEFKDIQEPYAIDISHALVRKLSDAAVFNKVKARVKGSQGATVITFFRQRKIPAIGFGCGSSGRAHSNNEYVKISNLYKGANILETFLKNYIA